MFFLSPIRHHWLPYYGPPFEQLCTIPLVIEVQSRVSEKGHSALYTRVKSPPELDNYGFTVRVSRDVNQFLEMVYVVFYQILALVPTSTFQFGKCRKLLVLGAELLCEIQLEVIPIPIAWLVFVPCLKDSVSKVCCSSRLEGESPVNVSLVHLGNCLHRLLNRWCRY